MEQLIRTLFDGFLLTFYLLLPLLLPLSCTSNDGSEGDIQLHTEVSIIDSFPRLPPECTAVTLRDSMLYFTSTSPPHLQCRRLRSAESETISALPEATHPAHIAVYDDRIAIADVGMNCIWTLIGDSIRSNYSPGVYRRLTPLSSAWLSRDSVVFSGFWFSRISERLYIHHGCGSFDLHTGRVQFDYNTVSTSHPDSVWSSPQKCIVVQDGDVRVVNLSEHQLTVRSIMANDDRSVSTIPLPELKPPHANRAGKMAGCVSGSDGFIYCLIHGNMSSTILVYRGDSVKPAYYEIPEIEPDWKLIGAMDDFIIWQPSSGKLVRFGGHTL